MPSPVPPRFRVEVEDTSGLTGYQRLRLWLFVLGLRLRFRRNPPPTLDKIAASVPRCLFAYKGGWHIAIHARSGDDRRALLVREERPTQTEAA